MSKVIPKPDNYIGSVALASFDPLEGTTLLCQWEHSLEITGGILEDYLRFCFRTNYIPPQSKSNSSPQQETPAALEFQTSIVSIPSNGHQLVTTKFQNNKQNKITSYCMIFVLYIKNIIHSDELNSMLNSVSTVAAAQAKAIIQKGDPIDYINPIVARSVHHIKALLESHIEKTPPMPQILQTDIPFYSAALSSHFQTQMTTIIEASSIEIAKPIFDFLSHFLLPYQFALSSPIMHNEPIRGLYLQCVRKCNELPKNLLFQFDRSWTWVRADSHIVFQSPNIYRQQQISREYMMSITFDSSASKEEIEARLTKFKKVYKTDLATHEAERWSSVFIRKLPNASPVEQEFLCNTMVRNLLEKGMLLIELVDHYLNETGLNFLRAEQTTEITGCLGITDKDELGAITAVAQLYDQRTFKRMITAKDVLKKLLAV
ncbi:hypothetical protein TVAG_354080 [Trichomonas vaginalis G3]|uniref:Uncharacterized protein n=1 Tax=Trichomonas vaginalis (strain ATCC PRA-98 / G3) TaxID=412133 RepID=A2FH28_TRIV3|nr:guanine nucleotide exchange c9orf72 family [Trichomonas vaginalis G3]EAX95796.1 hypothetical protein TVAG_354080 [Trichomonas vaginalis G3]KAI5536534.1 guanine nucleotide exchange c9orf72 family [Trichomonas vaginalis G3]|eukprot:XP_001308726.1 hypothetical protein [Trichomonas vaginalis G3]